MEVTLQNRLFTGHEKQVHPAVFMKMNVCISKYNPSMTIISKNLLVEKILWLTVENVDKVVRGIEILGFYAFILTSTCCIKLCGH